MKKILFILAAVTIAASGVAAVSAYEAHLINVTAHVENALTVDTSPMEFGTVFPEEWMWEKTLIQLSDSAVAEKGTGASMDLNYVEYEIFAEWKPVPDDAVVAPVVVGSDQNDYYSWLGGCLYVGLDTVAIDANNMTLIGPALAGAPSAQGTGLMGQLDGLVEQMLYVAIDAPVFEGYYNVHTDPTPKPSGLDWPTWIIPEFLPDGSPNPLWDKDGIDLGLDLKIQVTDIVRFP